MKKLNYVKIIVAIILLIVTAYCIIMAVGLNLNGFRGNFDIGIKYLALSVLFLIVDVLLIKDIMKK